MDVVPKVQLVPCDPLLDADALVVFLTSDEFPFHVVPSPTETQARALVDGGRFWSDDSHGFWVDVDGERIGVVVLDELIDVAWREPTLRRTPGREPSRPGPRPAGRAGVHDPGLHAIPGCHARGGSDPRGRRHEEGQTREDDVTMRRTFVRAGFVKEAHYREAWPTFDAGPKAAIADATLRRDWETGTTTPVPWDDPEP